MKHLSFLIMFTYKSDFKELISYCEKTFCGSHERYLGDAFIIGGGNPGGHILFIGAEPSKKDNEPLSDADRYNQLGVIKDNLKKEICCIRKRTEGEEGAQNYWGPYRKQTVWYNYQRLFDYIQFGYVRDHDQELDFEEHVFCTELSGIPKKHSALSKETKNSIEIRKKYFFTHPFFDRFDVIVINTASGYIRNDSTNPDKREIDQIFKVKYISSWTNTKKTNTFWIHQGYVNGFPRILIHTKNLSYGVDSHMLQEIGITIRRFLNYP